MSGFSADWLALREPADAAARALTLNEAVAHRLAPHSPVHVLDLGAGTGSNLRYLVEHLPREQRWLLVDHDLPLLADAQQRMLPWAEARAWQVAPDDDGFVIGGAGISAHVSTRCLDLQANAGGAELYVSRHLVTASALLDLVSEPWLRTLADRCAEHGATVLFALSYDGRMHCTPEEPGDVLVRDLVNRHQRTDKGFGVAGGPDAATLARNCFASVGYQVRCEPSDWVLTPDDRELQRPLIDGWAEAATAIAPEHARVIASWLARRHEHVDADRSRIVVGHTDLAAWPR